MIFLGSVITILGTVLMAWIHPLCAVLFFVFTALLIAIYSLEIKKRRDKLQQLNTYLSLICAGKYDLDIADNEEGEISILKNNLYKPESVKLSYFLQELLRIDVIHCFTPYQGTQFLFVV